MRACRCGPSREEVPGTEGKVSLMREIGGEAGASAQDKVSRTEGHVSLLAHQWNVTFGAFCPTMSHPRPPPIVTHQ